MNYELIFNFQLNYFHVNYKVKRHCEEERRSNPCFGLLPVCFASL